MIKRIASKQFSLANKITVMLVVFCSTIIPAFEAQDVSAAACAVPSTDYGQVTGMSVSASTTATYRIWSRMAAPNATNNTYLLEVDGTNCYTVGGSSVPVYNAGTSAYFIDSKTNWINKTNTGTVISLPLSAGTHTVKLIGNAPGVVVDRLIFTASTTCAPTGTGNNCADALAPVVSSVGSTSVTQNSATISWSTNELSSTQVEYGTTTGYGSMSTLAPQLVTTHSASLTSLAAGVQYHYRVISVDEAGNTTSSGDSTFTTVSVLTYAASDINQDGATGILDVSLLAANWNRSGAGIGRSDINGDGAVNSLDLSLLITNYGK